MSTHYSNMQTPNLHTAADTQYHCLFTQQPLLDSLSAQYEFQVMRFVSLMNIEIN